MPLRHNATASPRHCVTVSLCHCVTALQRHGIMESMCHCTNTWLHHSVTSSMHDCVTASSRRSVIASLRHCVIASQCHSITASLRLCVIASALEIEIEVRIWIWIDDDPRFPSGKASSTKPEANCKTNELAARLPVTEGVQLRRLSADQTSIKGCKSCYLKGSLWTNYVWVRLRLMIKVNLSSC